MADKVSIVIDAGHGDRIQELYFRDGKKKQIPCGWRWQ